MPPSVPLTSRTRAAKPILGVGAHRPTPGREPLQPACLCQAPESRAACQGLGWPPASGGRGSRLSCCGPAWAESGGQGLAGKMRGGAPRVLARAHPSKAQLGKPACPGAPLCQGA